MLELAGLFEQHGSVAERDRWPSYLRGLSENLRSDEPIDISQFHRQLSGGRASMADSNIDGVWDAIERIVNLLPEYYRGLEEKR